MSILTFSFNFTSSFLILVTLMAVFPALIPSPIYSLPPEILKPKNVGLEFGVMSTCSSIGLFIAPYLVGKTKDITGSDHWSFILISLFFLLITVSILLARRICQGDFLLMSSPRGFALNGERCLSLKSLEIIGF